MQQLQKIEVVARSPGTVGILPTKVVVPAAFGPGHDVLNTPRTITPISTELIRAADIRNLRDIMKVVPDSYTSTDFGAPSLPAIRGQLAELFQDGVRRQSGNNGFGLPLSFNSVASMNVVKGPPPVVLGSTQRVGGFVNLVSKRPDLDRAKGEVYLQTGSWRRNTGQIDYSAPLTPGRSALRLSVEVKHEGSYYDFAHHHSQDVYLAYRLKPNAHSLLDVNVEYYNVNFTDIAGINRPTQNLIDHGLYVTGQGVQPNGSTVPGAFALVSPTGEVKIPRHRVLTDPRDSDGVRTWLAHATWRDRLSDALQLVNRTYYQHLQRSEIANNSFTEIIRGADTAENRTELNITENAGGMAQSTDVGIDVRYNRVLGYSQFDTEADLPIDLTGPLQNRRIPLTATQKAALVRLRPGLYVSPGAQYDINGDGSGDFMLSDTTDSRNWQTGLFVQHTVHFSPQWSAIVGARGDLYNVQARDPLPPPGQTAASDSIRQFLKSGNASLTWTPHPSLSVYGTASYSEATSNSIAGGTTLGSGNRIDAQNFRTRSRLYELGLKYGPPHGNWYADASVFDQTRSLRNRDGSLTGIRSRGLDTQLFYQSDNHLIGSLSASYLDARYDHSASSQDTRQVLDAFDDSRPDIVHGTGVGAPNFASFPASTQRLQGVPRVLVSALLGYRPEHGLGGALSGVYTGPFPLDYLQTVRVGPQYTLDASVDYHWARTGTELRLTVNNITRQANFAPTFEGGYFGATDVYPLLPINVLLSLRQSF